MAFLPEGSMPYLQYVVNDENSIAWDMGELGYSKTAIHPYYSEEWNRTQVYQFLGFDQFISGVDFGNAVGNKRDESNRQAESKSYQFW
jgi:Phosphoglycerol transferase and related proteins, alkaline phosphatase superfamily